MPLLWRRGLRKKNHSRLPLGRRTDRSDRECSNRGLPGLWRAIPQGRNCKGNGETGSFEGNPQEANSGPIERAGSCVGPCPLESGLLPVPVGLMTFVAGLLGKRDVADRLFGSLQVDSSKARDLLGWEPVVYMDEGLNPQITQIKNIKNGSLLLRQLNMSTVMPDLIRHPVLSLIPAFAGMMVVYIIEISC